MMQKIKVSELLSKLPFFLRDPRVEILPGWRLLFFRGKTVVSTPTICVAMFRSETHGRTASSTREVLLLLVWAWTWVFQSRQKEQWKSSKVRAKALRETSEVLTFYC